MLKEAGSPGRLPAGGALRGFEGGDLAVGRARQGVFMWYYHWTQVGLVASVRVSSDAFSSEGKLDG